MKQINLTEEEIIKILEMHKNATSRHYLNEQSSTQPPYRKLEPIKCRTKALKKGDRGEMVQLIQHGLAKCGFNSEKQGGGMNVGCKTDYTKCDGKFGNETDKAVREAQEKWTDGTPDGIVGHVTLGVLIENECIGDFDTFCNNRSATGSNDQGGNLTNNGCEKAIYCATEHFMSDGIVGDVRRKEQFCKYFKCLGCPIPENLDINCD